MEKGRTMAGFKDILGHEQIIAHLQNAIAMDKVSHAYILNGPEKSGKMMLAEAFAQTLQCEKHTGPSGEGGGEENRPQPCMECRSCRQAAGHNQPDIVYVRHEKPNTISVDDIRTQVNHDIVIKPYSSRYKIYIIDEAEKMNVQAQNALLKTIEEPPAYAVILLLTTNAESFLPTILSRCVLLNLKAVPDEKIRKYLMEQGQIPDYQADICVAFAQGNVGKAVQLASSEHFGELKAATLQLIRRLDDIDFYEMGEAVRQISEYKLKINDYFELMTVWYRDVLLYKATKDVNGLIFKDEVYEIRRKAEKSSYGGLETIIKALHKAQIRLDANVNFDLVIELLLLTIKEN
jgi:DNA polymerase-3 subunit delta'